MQNLIVVTCHAEALHNGLCVLVPQLTRKHWHVRGAKQSVFKCSEHCAKVPLNLFAAQESNSTSPYHTHLR